MKPHVAFVGAGPGAEDLITLRGLRMLEKADLVVYAGSLVNPALLERCRTTCVFMDSATMTLEKQIAAMSEAALGGKNVVRLHTGDPAIYGAINEQISALAQKGVKACIIPGVSSVFAAAAALGRELTCPGTSQSVVLTRSPGRTPMPESEDPAVFANTGATMAFFLSSGGIDALMRRLMKGGLPAETPAVIAYRVSWPDERIIRGTVGDIARKAEEAGINRHALVLAGRALRGEGRSRLYAADFSHGYRHNLHDEAFNGRCALYAFTDNGLRLAESMASGLGLPAVVHSTRPSNAKGIVHTPGKDFDTRLAANWKLFDAHIFISATGIAVRKIAPLLRDKKDDPAVLVCGENGSHVISLTGGHLGGANRLARRIARIVGGQAVVSTATDIRALPAFDDIAAREGARILNAEAVLPLNAALLAGETIAFCGSRDVFERHFMSHGRIFFTASPKSLTSRYAVLWDAEAPPPEKTISLSVTSRAFIIGVGCRRGIPPRKLRETAEGYLAALGLNSGNIAAIASCEAKADEPAILELGKIWQTPVQFHSVTALDTVPVPTPSETVRARMGTGSVCEAACLLSAGYGKEGRRPRLHKPKVVIDGVTLALARLPHESRLRGAGGIVVAGLGSGLPGQITPETEAALRYCDTVVGYSRYMDFIRARVTGKEIIENGMRGEVERCRAALEAAACGKSVCVVCSGDPGIFAMAGLLHELRSSSPDLADVSIRVLPGITAASLAAAALGAPFQNGFSLLSLSDLLVPADEIRRNLLAAAQSSLPAAIYNPAGRRRRRMLGEALDLSRKHRGQDVPCAYVKNAGRPQEKKWIGRLADFPVDDVDMSTLVIIGGVRTRMEGDTLYEARGYAEKYPMTDEGNDTR